MNRRLLGLILASLGLGGPVLAQAPAQTAPAAPAPAPAPIPAADFARIPYISQPELSPNGLYLGGLMGVEGQQIVAIISLFDQAKPVALKLPEDNQAAWVQWVNNDNMLIGIRALLPVDGGDRWIISRVISVHRPTGKVTRILQDQNGQSGGDVLWTAKDGSPEILVAAQNSIYADDEEFWPKVWKVNVQTGRRVPDQKGRAGVMEWYADAAGQVRAGIWYEDRGRKFRLLYRAPGEDSLRTVDRADTKQQESLLAPFLFLPGTNNALAVRDDENGRSAIYEVDMTTRQNLRTVFSAPDGGEVSGAIVSADGMTLLGASYTGKSDGLIWLDPTLAELQKAIDKALGTSGRRAWVASMSDDRTRMLVSVDRPDSPGALYYFNTAGGSMQRIAYFNEALGTKPLNPVRMIQYKARDGLEIEAVLTLPRDRPAKTLPVVLMPHGGPWAHDTLDYDYWAQFVASRGYAVIQPNFRGSTGYGTEFLSAGQGQMGFAMQDDISDALAWAVKEGIADPARACIVGASYGGYAAMWGIAKDPDQYRCAISIAGVSNLRRDVNDFGDSLMGGKFRDDWRRMTPDFAAVSPINAVARIKAPLLLIHGKKDITVDWVQSSSMASKMRGAGKSVELIALPDADHHFTRQDDRLALLNAIESFLARHNPAGGPSGASGAK